MQLREPVDFPSLGPANNLIEALFGIEMETTFTCGESEEEPVVKTRELTTKLQCIIEGGAGKTVQVNHLHHGVLHVRFLELIGFEDYCLFICDRVSPGL